jgi:3'-5' exoribonuclease
LPQFPEALLLHYLDDLDSKMEAMRALIANDRQVEGCFTAYNAPMERAALKMDRFLNTPQRATVPAAAASATAPPAQAKPDAPAAHAALAPKADSPFAAKLRHAVQPDTPGQEK